jgi:hypothetical protein
LRLKFPCDEYVVCGVVLLQEAVGAKKFALLIYS